MFVLPVQSNYLHSFNIPVLLCTFRSLLTLRSTPATCLHYYKSNHILVPTEPSAASSHQLYHAMSRVFYWPASFLLFAFASEVLALSAIQGSPCYDTCNGDQATSSADIVCTDDDFTNSTKGETLSQCLTCLQTSSYGSGYMTDSILFLC